jgi:hypothetical protein
MILTVTPCRGQRNFHPVGNTASILARPVSPLTTTTLQLGEKPDTASSVTVTDRWNRSPLHGLAAIGGGNRIAPGLAVERIGVQAGTRRDLPGRGLNQRLTVHAVGDRRRAPGVYARCCGTDGRHLAVGNLDCSVVGLAALREDGYSDGLHLAVFGGNKLADIVAPEVLSLAHERGYR